MDVRKWEWPALGLLALILLIRFPVKFLLEPPYLMDFEVYRAVAERLMHDGAATLYHPTTSEVMLFKYAPCWALAWMPLAWIPARPGAVLWAVLTVVWLIASCRGAFVLCRRAGLSAPPWIAPAAAALLARPIMAEFLNGQVDLLWGALLIGFLVAETSSRRWWGPLCLAAAISLKVPALIVLPYLLVRGRWSVALRTLAALLILNLAAGFILSFPHPFRLFHDWAQVLWSSGSSRAFEIGNQSLLALAGRFLSPNPYDMNVLALPAPAVLLVAVAASALLFGAVVANARVRLAPPARLVWDGALLAIVMVLASPTVWVATYSALLLPTMLAVACAVGRLRDTCRHAPSMAAAVAVIGLSALTHSTVWKALGIRYFRGESYVFLVLMVLPWWALALFGYLWSRRGAAPGISGS